MTRNEFARSVHSWCVELTGMSSEMSRSDRTILATIGEWRIARSASIHLRLESGDGSRARAVEGGVLGFVRDFLGDSHWCC